MKKLFLPILLSLMLVSCAKIPFAEQEPVAKAALVYLYAYPSQNTNRATKYKLAINGKHTKGFLGAFEYVAYDLKPMTIVLAAIRNDVEKQELSLSLEAGKSYYVKVTSSSDDFAKFDIALIEESLALQELKLTTLAGAYKKDSSIIDALIVSEKDTNKELVHKEGSISTMSAEELEALIEKKVSERTSTPAVSKSSTPSLSRTGNKLEDLRNAYEMKKQGMLSEEEFKAMKAEILAK